MKIKVFRNIDDIYYNVDNFPSSNKILLITGLSGSGKSHLSKEIAKEYNAIHFQVEWLIHKSHVSDECKYILDSFLDKYPSIVPLVDSKWDNVKVEDNNKLLKHYMNLFFKHFLEVKDPNKAYIVEGLQLFTLIDYDLIKDYPIIIKGTSSINSLKRRLRRDYKKRKNQKLNVRVKFLFRVLKQSRLYQFKHRKKLNLFIEKRSCNGK